MRTNIKLYYFFISIIGGIFSSAMPLYYESLAYSSMQIGILIALPSVAMLLQPIWGIIVDKFEKPREVAIIGISISALILALLLFTTNFYFVFAIILLYCIIKAPVWSSVDNIIITYCMNNNINYGPLRVFASAAWGSSLLLFVPFVLLFGFKSFFIINLFISMFIVYIVLKLPTNIKLHTTEAKETTSFAAGIHELKRDREFMYITLFTLFFSALFVTNLNYQALYLEELGASELLISLAMFFSILPELILLPLGERIAKRINPLTMLQFVTVCYIIKFIVYANITTITILIAFSALHGIAMSFYIPIFIKLIKASVPNNVSTTAITINGFVAAITGIIISIIAGYIASLFGTPSVFCLTTIMQSLAFIVLVFFKRYNRQIKTKEQ